MIFNEKYSITKEIQDFCFLIQVINIIDAYRYLGIIFSNKKDMFSDNLYYLKNKALRAAGDIRANINKITGMNKPYNVLMKLFDSQILPILEYGAEIWYAGKNLARFESVHLAFLKYGLGVNQQT